MLHVVASRTRSRPGKRCTHVYVIHLRFLQIRLGASALMALRHVLPICTHVVLRAHRYLVRNRTLYILVTFVVCAWTRSIVCTSFITTSHRKSSTVTSCWLLVYCI